MPERLDAAQRRLQATQDRKRRTQMGPPLSQDDEAISRLARVGPETLAEIEAFVRDAAGDRGVDMLRARAE